jgi:thymidylate synthase ThyX
VSEGLHANPEFPVELPYRRVLDKGFVALVDVMGNDASIVQAARVSYGKGTKTVRSDKALISYLMRHRHTTPWEMIEFKFLMRLPVFIARQVIRHRTACLAEGTVVDLVGGPLRIEEVGGLRGLRVLQLDETTRGIREARVVGLHRNGPKPVFRMILADGKRIEATKDHRFLFAEGWRTLEQATGLFERDGVATWRRGTYRLHAAGGAEESGGVAVAVGTLVRVERFEYVGVKETYDLEVEGPYHNFLANGIVTHNSVNEYSARYSLVPDRFWVPDLGAIAEQDAVNRQGRADLLGELAEAAPERKEPCAFVPDRRAVLAREGKGISCAALLDPAHRAAFLGGDVLPSESYVRCAELLLDLFPERKARLERIRETYRENNERCYGLYQRLLEQGVAREIARSVLPLSMYTEWYWKIDLHNLLHFLKLRMDPHAQLEVRAYGEAMATFVKEAVPLAWEAFENDNLMGTFLSRAEKDVLRPGGRDAQVAALRALFERGYRRRRLKEVCRKLDLDERLVDAIDPPGKEG